MGVDMAVHVFEIESLFFDCVRAETFHCLSSGGKVYEVFLGFVFTQFDFVYLVCVWTMLSEILDREVASLEFFWDRDQFLDLCFSVKFAHCNPWVETLIGAQDGDST